MPEWDEGFGITIIEAMAAGLLCICRAKGGIPEIMTNGKNGILIYSTKELTKVLSDLLLKPIKSQIFKIRNNAVIRSKDFDIHRFSIQLDFEINSLNL